MQKKYLLILAVSVIVIASASIMLMMESGETIEIKGGKIIIYDPNNPNYLIQSAKGRSYVDGPVNQSMRLHIRNLSSREAKAYMFSSYDRNITFRTDIVLPPNVECYIYYPTTGGPIKYRVLNLGQGNREPSGGEYAFSTDSLTGYALDTQTAVTVYTRAGNTYVFNAIRTELYREGD